MIDDGYPEVGVTAERLVHLMENVGMGIMTFPKKGLSLSFTTPFYHEKRYVLYVCPTHRPEEWLLWVIPKLRPWKEADQRVVQTNIFHKLHRILAWIPEVPVETTTILRRLQ